MTNPSPVANNNMKRTPIWKWSLILVAEVFGFLMVYGLAQSLNGQSNNLPLQLILMIAAGLAIVGIYTCLRRLLEKSWPKDVLDKYWAAKLASGFGIGFCFILLTTALMALATCYRIDSLAFDWKHLLPDLAFFFLVACGEEVIFRGLIFRMIQERFNPTAALVASAFLFGFLHIANPGATVWSSLAIAVEAGLMLGAIYYRTRSLWIPIGVHWAWNFAEGDIFGFAVSGSDGYSPVISPIINGPEILTGGEFGAEASIISVVLGALITMLTVLPRKKKV